MSELAMEQQDLMRDNDLGKHRKKRPYIPVGDEIDVFTAAWQSGLPVMLKGPTGCGKTRLVEHMADQFGVPLFTVCCHEDMTSSDLLGRFVLRDSRTEWVDGPLTRRCGKEASATSMKSSKLAKTRSSRCTRSPITVAN